MIILIANTKYGHSLVQDGPDHQRGVGIVQSAAKGPPVKLANYKVRDDKIRDRAQDLRVRHPDWSTSNVAKQLKNDMSNKSADEIADEIDDIDAAISKLSHRRLREIIRIK